MRKLWFAIEMTIFGIASAILAYEFIQEIKEGMIQ